jgi:hypothetical protein
VPTARAERRAAVERREEERFVEAAISQLAHVISLLRSSRNVAALAKEQRIWLARDLAVALQLIPDEPPAAIQTTLAGCGV